MMMGKLPPLLLIVLATCARESVTPLEQTDLAVAGEVLARLHADLELPAGYAAEPLATAGWYRVRFAENASNPIAAARRLARLPGVEAAQPNWRYQPHATPRDNFFALPNSQDWEQVAHVITDAEDGWDVTTGSDNTIVAVLGYGIQLDHPDLDDNLWINSGETPDNSTDDDGNGCIDDIHGCDFENGDGNPSASDVHETRVAGIIAAEEGPNDSGVGVMWEAGLMAVRIVLTSEQVAQAIDYAVDNGAHVINMSFGIYLPGVYGEDSIVHDALLRAEAADVVTVASAGNDGVFAPSYPAAHPLVIGVGGTNNSDGPWSSTNNGWWVDCAAPAVNLVTTSNGSVVTRGSGTSFAAPYVAGLAGLVRTENPGWTAAQVREQILFTGEKVTSGYLGYTRVNVANALTDVRPAPMARLRRPEDSAVRGRGSIEVIGAAVGDSYTLEWRASGGSWANAASGAEVLDDVLGTLDTSSWEIGEYELRLTVNANSSSDIDQVSFYLVPRYVAGWPRGTFGRVVEGPTFGDIDGDGSFEVLAADAEAPLSRGNWVHTWDSDGTPLLSPGPYWHGHAYPHTPALADIDGNGDIEIVVTARGGGGGIYVWQHDDRVNNLWSQSTEEIYALPVVADLDGNGSPEIVVVEHASSATNVHVLDSDGDAVSGWPVAVSDGGRASPVVADFDGDGAFDILVATETEEILLDAGGNDHTNWPRNIDGAWSDPAAADFDGDGDAELVSVQFDAVEIVDGDGTVLGGWPQTIPDSSNNRVAIGDLDADGVPEVVLGLKNNQVRAWHADGSAVSGWPQSTGGAIWSAAAIADLDGDGNVDVAISSRDRYLHAWSAAGVPLADFPRRLPGPSDSSPAVGDLDGNGTLDLAVGNGNSRWFVHLWDLGVTYDPFTVEWGRVRHDEVNSGYYPNRFALNGSGTSSSASLSWSAPTDIPAPASYAVYRNGTRVTSVTTTSYEDVPPANGTWNYGVVALGDAGTVRARSVIVSVTLDDVPPQPDGGGQDGGPQADGGTVDDDGRVVRAKCGCRTVGAPLLWLLLVLPMWRRRRRRRFA